MSTGSGSPGHHRGPSVRLWVTLGAALSAVALATLVSITGSERPTAESTSAPSVSPRATPSRTVSRGLPGKGPFIVYAAHTFGLGEIFAYDVSSEETIPIGMAYAPSTDGRSIQAGSGRLIAFAGSSGMVWRVDRGGLHSVGTIRPFGRNESLRTGDDLPDSFGGVEGSALSPDLRFLATVIHRAKPALVVMDLHTGQPAVFPQSAVGVHEALIPVGWSIDGSAIYEIPICHCGGGTPGLYRFDMRTGRSSLLGPTRDKYLYQDVVASQDGRTVVYGTRQDFVPCVDGGEPLCSGPPFELRRLSPDGLRSTLLQRSGSASFEPLVVSSDGRRVLVKRVDHETRAARLETVDPRSGRQIGSSEAFGLPQGTFVGAILPDGALVAFHIDSGRIYLMREGRAQTIAKRRGPSRQITYLGWLR
jgi:hypothetical protein